MKKVRIAMTFTISDEYYNEKYQEIAEDIDNGEMARDLSEEEGIESVEITREDIE